ncbi:hypothetical protein Bca52824_004942 [Brassica carinata]|uniref:Uncharacterized protein n=1 Tax=Brassica carinata TaxID=52824 RepID=A0A8X8BH55_BRACI|nr:hypothetical protein Bca52824_004942 [Brassica carinata]
MATSSSEEIFEQVDVSKPVDSSTHSLPQTSDAPLGEVDNVVDNTFTSPTSVPFVHNNLFAVLIMLKLVNHQLFHQPRNLSS